MDDLHPLLLDPVHHASVACSPAASFELANFTICGAYPSAVSVLSSVEGVAPDFDEVGRLVRENLELRQQVGYWKSLHQRACTRLAECAAQVAQLQAKVKLRERQMFGRKSEKGTTRADAKSASATDAPTGASRRRRGQQPGKPKPTRRNYDHLPVTNIPLDLAEEDKMCPCCSLPCEPFPGTEDSELIEVEVRAHRRRYQRQR